MLRGLPAQARATPDFFLAEDECPAPADHGTGAVTWDEADVRRAVAAATQAGLEDFRIEIAPDGTIAIVVGSPDPGDPSSRTRRQV